MPSVRLAKESSMAAMVSSFMVNDERCNVKNQTMQS